MRLTLSFFFIYFTTTSLAFISRSLAFSLARLLFSLFALSVLPRHLSLSLLALALLSRYLSLTQFLMSRYLCRSRLPRILSFFPSAYSLARSLALHFTFPSSHDIILQRVMYFIIIIYKSWGQLTGGRKMENENSKKLY